MAAAGERSRRCALVRPEGHALLGELYWKQEPDPAYLVVVGGGSASRDDIATTNAENVAAGQAAGLIPLHISVSSEDKWDHYEQPGHNQMPGGVLLP